MKAIFRINAAPGFEDAVEAAVRKDDAVFNVVREKEGNFDLVIGVEAEDRDDLTSFENQISLTSGVQGVLRVTAPDQALLDRLRPG